MFRCQEITINVTVIFLDQHPPTPSFSSSSLTECFQKCCFFLLFWLINHFPHFDKTGKTKRKNRNGEKKNTETLTINVSSLSVFGLVSLFLFYFSFQDRHLIPQIYNWTQPNITAPTQLSAATVRLSGLWMSKSLRHDTKHRVVATDARPDLFVVLFGVADLVELRLWKYQGK